MVLVTSSFPYVTEILRKLSANLGTRSQRRLPALFQAEEVQRIFVCRGANSLACQGRQINALPGAPTCLESVIHVEGMVFAISRTNRETVL